MTPQTSAMAYGTPIVYEINQRNRGSIIDQIARMTNHVYFHVHHVQFRFYFYAVGTSQS